MTVLSPPGQLLLQSDLAAPAFRCGEIAGHWRLVSVAWPHAVIAVSAPPRLGAPVEYAFRFECTGYRQRAVTATPWDASANVSLPSPAGRREGRSFPPCSGRSSKTATASICLAIGWAFEGHTNWPNEHPSRLWQPARGIICYLEQIHDLFHQSDYSGLSGA